MNLVENRKTLAVFGYMIVANDEMHSRQIHLLNSILEENGWDEDRDIIYDILNDRENTVSLDEALELVKMEVLSIQIFLYHTSYQLALIDHDSFEETYIDAEEKNILYKLERCINDVDFVKEKKIAYRKLKIYIDRELNSNDNVMLDLDFWKLNEQAQSDFSVMSSVIKDLLSECDLLTRKLDNLDEMENSKFQESLDAFKKSYKVNVLETLEKLKESLPQKELASQGFTLALMGRTKAGKSTLHAIMCKEGEEFIGKGGQRTTRYNRVFSWKGIKIIDTPGIGAGEESGKNDEKIARKVISQADIICFVIVDDTITKEILKMLDDIAAYHKPMIILLNHKDNINKKRHLKDFLNNPTFWKNTTGEQNLSGSINRLERNAKNKGYINMINIVPVFLLATMKGIQENNDTFYEASNFQQFIDTLEQMIKNNCMICKAQTILDDPTIQLYEASEQLDDQKEILQIFKSKIEGIKHRTYTTIDSIQRDAKRDANNIISTYFDTFVTENCEIYIDQNYDAGSTLQLQKAYEELRNQQRVYEHIQQEVDESMQGYCTRISEAVKELEKEIQYANINVSEAIDFKDITGLKKNARILPLKEILRFTSMGLDIAARWFPILYTIAIPLSFISSFFKPKRQKIENAKMHMKNNFSILVQYDMEYVQKSIVKNMDYIFKQNRRELEIFFRGFDNAMKEILECVEPCRNQLNEKLEVMDKYYARRILQFITVEAEKYTFRLSDINVSRFLKSNTIRIQTKVGDYFDTEKIKKITGENVQVIKCK